MIKVVIRNSDNEILIETHKLFDLITYLIGVNENGGRLLDIRIYSKSSKIYQQVFNTLYVKEEHGLGAFLEDVAKAVFPHSKDSVDDLRKELEALR